MFHAPFVALCVKLTVIQKSERIVLILEYRI